MVHGMPEQGSLDLNTGKYQYRYPRKKIVYLIGGPLLILIFQFFIFDLANSNAKEERLFFILTIIGAVVCFSIAAYHASFKIDMSLENGILRYFSKISFSKTSWSESIENYRGVYTEKIYHPERTDSEGYTIESEYYEHRIILKHKDNPDRHVQIMETHNGNIVRSKLEKYAIEFGLPILVYDSCGNETVREIKDFDKTLKEKILENGTEVSFQESELDSLKRFEVEKRQTSYILKSSISPLYYTGICVSGIGLVPTLFGLSYGGISQELVVGALTIVVGIILMLFGKFGKRVVTLSPHSVSTEIKLFKMSFMKERYSFDFVEEINKKKSGIHFVSDVDSYLMGGWNTNEVDVIHRLILTLILSSD